MNNKIVKDTSFYGSIICFGIYFWENLHFGIGSRIDNSNKQNNNIDEEKGLILIADKIYYLENNNIKTIDIEKIEAANGQNSIFDTLEETTTLDTYIKKYKYIEIFLIESETKVYIQLYINYIINPYKDKIELTIIYQNKELYKNELTKFQSVIDIEEIQ